MTSSGRSWGKGEGLASTTWLDGSCSSNHITPLSEVRQGGGSAAAGKRWCSARRPSAVAPLCGKKRKKEKFLSQESNWYDDDTKDVGASPAAKVAPTTSPVSGGDSTGSPSASSSSSSSSIGNSITDDTLLPSLRRTTPMKKGNDDNVLIVNKDGFDIDVDSNSSGDMVLEAAWVEGQTEGERPIVETYGLDTLAAEEDEIDIEINGLGNDLSSSSSSIVTSFPAGGVGPEKGLVDGVGLETWRNGMEVPDDDIILGEGLKMGRGLDEMLMERSIRFYDPKVRFRFGDLWYSVLNINVCVVMVRVESQQPNY